MTIAHCIGCGCTDLAACWDDEKGAPCHWVRVDRATGVGVCSCYRDLAPDWDQGKRQMRGPVEPGASA